MLAAVIDGAERDTVVVHLRREREHLEPTGVGQHVAVEAHEPVEAAERRHDIGTRAQHQVVRVGEHDLHAEVAEVIRSEVLHRTARTDRHEARRADLAPRRTGEARSGATVGSGDVEDDRGGRHRGACRSSSIASPNDRNRYCSRNATS